MKKAKAMALGHSDITRNDLTRAEQSTNERIMSDALNLKSPDSPDNMQDHSYVPNILKDAMESWECFKQKQIQRLGREEVDRLME